ncbi:immunity 22 family protein [Pedobacter sp. WC2423]|uniref:immunity 22 family protein n=1 Tax=Pedobacter sp. WC2423 TaxID=3234142 RepID=UPI00346515F5
MEEENKVSIFGGFVLSEEHLSSFVKENFTEDGDIYSDLMDDLKVDYIDNQFQEVLYIGKEVIKDDLVQFSYSESFLHLINEDLSGYNSVILLYNFNCKNKPQKITLIGVYDYR